MKNDLLNNIINFQNGDSDEFVNLVEKFEGAVNTLSYKYSVNGFEREDLIQESNIAILKAVERFDVNHSKANPRDYIFSTIINNLYNLVKSKAKYNNEITLTAFNNENSDFINSIVDDFSLEDDFLKSINVASLHYALNKLDENELSLIKHLYFDEKPLTEFCRNNNISYKSGRLKLEKILKKLKVFLE